VQARKAKREAEAAQEEAAAVRERAEAKEARLADDAAAAAEARYAAEGARNELQVRKGLGFRYLRTCMGSAVMPRQSV